MNIVNKLTVRHLKENKRRTWVTIIGVIISVAMITAVATLGVSFLDLMKRQTIATDGEWHVQYKDVYADQIEAIEEDETTQKLVIANDYGYAKIESENESKPYLFFKQYNEEGYHQFPISLSEGRLPTSNQEVVVPEEIADDAGVDYKIGDQITVDIGERHYSEVKEPLSQIEPLQMTEDGINETLEVKATETFTIVGTIERPTWEPSWSPGYTVIGYIDQSKLGADDKVDVVVVLDKVNSSLFKHAENLASQHNIDKVNFHSELLRYYGVTENDNLRSTLFSLAGIIMAVIIIGSVSLIYNAFAISVSERARHLGMLSSVGATKKQKRNSVFFEGAIIGFLSIPIGIISGIAGIGATFNFINAYAIEALGTTEKLLVVVTPFSILVACIVSIATIFISTYMPARKASKISAIDAIRQTQDVKLTSKKVKTSKLVRKIFGLEAEIGLKNLKRNKRRYQATVFSLIISIVLYLSVSYFTSSLQLSLDMSQEDINYDIQVTGSNVAVEEFEPLAKLENVTDATFLNQYTLEGLVEQEKLPDGLKELIETDATLLENGKYPYYVALHSIDHKSFLSYAEDNEINVEDMGNGETPYAIVIDETTYEDADEGKIIRTKTIHTSIGDTFDLYWNDYETEKREKTGTVSIIGLTDQAPMGVNPMKGLGGIDLIVSEEVSDQLLNKEVKVQDSSYLYMNSSDPMATQKAIEDVKKSNMYVYNVYQQRQQDEQIILFMSIFTYGFITLISAISIANIFNTISTSISLRKREFAMLRSVGMTPKGFNKMINYESIFYGLKAILYGLPISILIMYLIYRSTANTFDYSFSLPWLNLLYVVIAIFLVVSSAMLYSISKIRKENIIDSLKQENI
ncbi:ABC transporter permease [Aquibacillus koreensis]|uniref:ABC transporter permease n=1 Tax=Aquibacillus koreensis TaxID=279446 RepID=A0A9X3WRB9_9BACI|nr:ABC transporter permease [Aquibacillus koreensis]MCT2535241.1 ABC transporter permease [Aquibacillus koreensis]MDC3422856.1 ABC transporter permease [Aquibacillus koreensis]